MKVLFDGTEYEFELEEMDLSDAMTIYRKTGLSIGALMTGLAELHPEALRAVHWLMLKQAGRVTDMDKENFAVLKFGMAIADAYDAEEKAKAAENPTTEAPVEAPVTA